MLNNHAFCVAFAVSVASLPLFSLGEDKQEAPAPVIWFNTAPQTSMIQVAPFQQTSREEQYAWVGKAIDENLRADLAHVSSLQVVTPPSGSDDFLASAKALHAAMEIEGSYQITGSSLRIIANARDVASGNMVGSAKVSGEVSDLFKLEDDLSKQLKAELPGPVSISTFDNPLPAAVTEVGTSPGRDSSQYSYSRIIDDNQPIAYEGDSSWPAPAPYMGSTAYQPTQTYYPPVTQVYNTYVYPPPSYGYGDYGYGDYLYGGGFGNGFGLWSPFYNGGFFTIGNGFGNGGFYHHHRGGFGLGFNQGGFAFTGATPGANFFNYGLPVGGLPLGPVNIGNTVNAIGPAPGIIYPAAARGGISRMSGNGNVFQNGGGSVFNRGGYNGSRGIGFPTNGKVNRR